MGYRKFRYAINVTRVFGVMSDSGGWVCGLGVRVEVGVVGLRWQNVKPQPSKAVIGDFEFVSQPEAGEKLGRVALKQQHFPLMEG